ncbi:MAG TPA: choice-of-anchor D domain-containing protein [Candidatus Acidoferrum sp.]|jgi:hypothetical protein|nr:choice-of-anchor D domain-containing protein [Candidatus Acidoferrum sp.]
MVKKARRLTSALFLLSLTIAAFGAAPSAPPSEVGSGIFRGRRVTYQMVKGKMMFEGDIALEHLDHKLPLPTDGGMLSYLQYRWPLVGSVYQIPYIIDPASGDVANINTAVSTYNGIFSGIIQWVPHTTETDYIDFNLNPSDTSGVGNSYIGRVGGEQLIWGAGNCTVATLLHEMGHATGFWHEQSRPDRNSYVTVNNSNIINVELYASAPQYDDMQALTLYDWSSVMHYGAWTFTKNGSPTLESIPAGMPLSNNVGYSAADIDAIKRLYGATPTAVMVTTNPPGLQAIVDGVTVTTPQTYNWPLFSTHTLNVASAAQSQAGFIAGTTTATTFYYTYGRWNDNGAQSHTITVLPGNGEVAFPATAPAVTVYMASFIQIVPYTVTAYNNMGTVTPSPAPVGYSGVSGVYYTARQQVTLTAAPNSGQTFYQYINSPYWLPGGLSINPKTFYVPDTGNPIATTTYFAPASSPTYTFTTNPQDNNDYVKVDGSYWPDPISFNAFYYGDGSWNVGKTHSISVDTTQWPWTGNTRYVFSSWSDGGAQTHNISVPASSTTYTATLTPQYYLSDYANEGCAGSIGVVPSSPTGDGFYPTGTLLTFTETPNPGWTFTEWQQNLSGNTNPQNVTMNDELLVVADYSTTTTPVTLTSLSPSAAVSGGGNFTLTLTGAGFTSSTLVFVNNSFRTSTFVNSTKITVAMTSADLTTAGAQQIFVENFPSGAACAAYGALPFVVASAPIVTPTPQTLSFSSQLVNTTSSNKTVTLKNNGTASVTINSISATGNFAVASNTCGSSLNAGASCTVNVNFKPTISGSLTGSLAISDSAPDSPQTVALSGTGNLPLTISPATLSLGTVTVGHSSTAKTVSLTNNESTTLSFSFSASGNYSTNSSGTTCGVSLASKAKCNIAVTFTPTANGSINGAVTITDTAGFSPQLVGLSGTGSGGATAPLTFTPSTLSFGTQAVGTTSAGKSLTVKNNSASSLTLSTIATTGDFTATGSGTVPCVANLLLAASASCTLNVTFSPALGSSGTINGAVVITDNATVNQQILDAKGTSALQLTFAPSTLTFAAQTVATASAAQTVTLTNNLSTSVSPTITGSGDYTAAPGGSTPCTSTLGANAHCTFTVTFTPSAVGTRAATITVTDSANPSVEILSASGTGQ